MKKENKQKKREAEQEAEREEKDRQFKRQGNICLAVIVVCFVLMLIVGRLNAGAAWLGNFFLAWASSSPRRSSIPCATPAAASRRCARKTARADKITKNCLTNPVPRAYDRGDAECASPLIL